MSWKRSISGALNSSAKPMANLDQFFAMKTKHKSDLRRRRFARSPFFSKYGIIIIKCEWSDGDEEKNPRKMRFTQNTVNQFQIGSVNISHLLLCLQLIYANEMYLLLRQPTVTTYTAST